MSWPLGHSLLLASVGNNMAVVNHADTAMTLCLFRTVETNNLYDCNYINIRDKWLFCETCSALYRIELSANRQEMDHAFDPLTISSSEEDDITDDSPPLIDLTDKETSVDSIHHEDIDTEPTDDEEHGGEQASGDDFDYERVYGTISSRFLANPFFEASDED